MIWNNKIISILLMAMLALAFAACSDDADAPTPTPLPKEEISRTVLVYMVASNNLGSGNYDKSDLNEMLTAAQNGDLGSGRLLVYHAPYSGSASRCIPILKEITAEGIDTLKVYDAGTASVTVANMQQVIADVKELAPADDYGMIMWGHATGWLQDGIDDDDAPISRAGKAHSYGSDNSKWMNITSLGVALEGQDISFVYFDCCNMANMEVAYELRNATPVVLGSITEVPAWGMPYDKTLKYLFSSGDADVVGAAQSTYENNMSVYIAKGGGDYSCPVSMTVVYTQYLDQLAAATQEIYSQATASWPTGYSPIRLGRYYSSTQYNCFFDFADYIKAICSDDSLLEQWQDAFDAAVPYSATSPYQWGYVDISANCGLSTFIIGSATSTIRKTYNYDELQWYADVASLLPI